MKVEEHPESEEIVNFSTKELEAKIFELLEEKFLQNGIDLNFDKKKLKNDHDSPMDIEKKIQKQYHNQNQIEDEKEEYGRKTTSPLKWKIQFGEKLKIGKESRPFNV